MGLGPSADNPRPGAPGLEDSEPKLFRTRGRCRYRSSLIPRRGHASLLG
jgi:hypothetical protein